MKRKILLFAFIFFFALIVLILLFVYLNGPSCDGFEGKVCPSGYTCINLRSYTDGMGKCLLTNPLKFEITSNKSWGELKTISEKIKYQNSIETKQLYLTKQKLTQFPVEIKDLANLEVLDLSDNQLSELPEDIDRLSNLKILYLENNQFQKFPSALTKLSKLETLSLSGNQIGYMPDEIQNLKNLRILKIEDNSLASISPAISRLQNLKELYIGNNKLKILPQELNNLEPFIVQICPNPLTVNTMPKKFFMNIVAFRYLGETHESIYEETATKGEGITHLARRVVLKFLNYAQEFNTISVNNDSKTLTCLEDFLQNNTGSETLEIGDKRSFSADLVEKSIFSCNLINRICP